MTPILDATVSDFGRYIAPRVRLRFVVALFLTLALAISCGGVP